MSESKPAMWVRANVLELVIPSLQLELNARGWHCALAGSVLNKGESKHDLDIVVFPHCSENASIVKMREGLHAAGLHIERTAEELRRFWREKGSEDRKHVEIWATAQGRRIDVIVWPIRATPSTRVLVAEKRKVTDES